MQAFSNHLLLQHSRHPAFGEGRIVLPFWTPLHPVFQFKSVSIVPLELPEQLLKQGIGAPIMSAMLLTGGVCSRPSVDTGVHRHVGKFLQAFLQCAFTFCWLQTV